jgi:hypothetical protein
MGSTLRQFLRDLFGSRYTAKLEVDLLRLRQDFEQRLLDKDLIIADLRTEKAALQGKINVYEMTIMPHASRAGADVVASLAPKKKPNFSDFSSVVPKSRWQIVQEEHEAQIAKELAEEEQQKKQVAAQ